LSLNKEKITAVILFFTLMISPIAVPFINSNQVQAAGLIPLDGLAEAEELLYGAAVENKSILERVAALEKSIYQSKQSGSIVQRSERLINDLFKTTDKSPSLLFMYNTVEWAVSGQLKGGNLLDRIASLEKAVSGEINEGSLAARIKEIHQLTISGKNIPVKAVQSQQNKLIRIELMEAINSNTTNKGQKVPYRVVEDIEFSDILVIPAGTRGELQVTEIEEAGKMGQDGSIKIGFPKLTTIDGTPLEVAIEQEAQKENESQKLAIGASVLGTALLGLPGVVVGYFVEGEEEKIPAGSELYIQVTEEKEIKGLAVDVE